MIELQTFKVVFGMFPVKLNQRRSTKTNDEMESKMFLAFWVDSVELPNSLSFPKQQKIFHIFRWDEIDREKRNLSRQQRSSNSRR